MTTMHIRPGPGALTEAHTTAVVPVGTQWTNQTTQGPKRYVFGYNGGATITAAGDCLAAFLTTPKYGNFSRTEATVLATSLGTVSRTAAIAIGAIATTEYGWIQVGGYCSNITTDAGVAQGDHLVMDGGATETFIADTAAGGEEHAVFGVADAADTATVGTGWLTGCLFDY